MSKRTDKEFLFDIQEAIRRKPLLFWGQLGYCLANSERKIASTERGSKKYP
ncbi:MAG: hypothetical protein JW957_08550 [Candidatus Omnitrophica bacterium]|nr:hypothetical protein [Candidatus Omnitrophota bacterium]